MTQCPAQRLRGARLFLSVPAPTSAFCGCCTISTGKSSLYVLIHRPVMNCCHLLPAAGLVVGRGALYPPVPASGRHGAPATWGWGHCQCSHPCTGTWGGTFLSLPQKQKGFASLSSPAARYHCLDWQPDCLPLPQPGMVLPVPGGKPLCFYAEVYLCLWLWGGGKSVHPWSFSSWCLLFCFSMRQWIFDPLGQKGCLPVP